MDQYLKKYKNFHTVLKKNNVTKVKIFLNKQRGGYLKTYFKETGNNSYNNSTLVELFCDHILSKYQTTYDLIYYIEILNIKNKLNYVLMSCIIERQFNNLLIILQNYKVNLYKLFIDVINLYSMVNGDNIKLIYYFIRNIGYISKINKLRISDFVDCVDKNIIIWYNSLHPFKLPRIRMILLNYKVIKSKMKKTNRLIKENIYNRTMLVNYTIWERIAVSDQIKSLYLYKFESGVNLYNEELFDKELLKLIVSY